VLRLAVRVRGEDAEIVLAELLELAPGGVEEVDVGDGVIEYAVYGPPGEIPALPDLRAAAGGALIDVSTREIPDDWDQRWREFHRPLVLSGQLTVRPPWEPPGDTPIDIVVDPGQAFGTGAHPTTRLCLELLLELVGRRGEEPPGSLGALLDLGCGSGVLAIAAARLGWAPVLAADSDPASLVAARENAVRNGVVVEVARHDLRRDPVLSAPTVVANLLAPLLVEWAGRLARVAAAEVPARVIASGVLRGEADRVAGAFAVVGLGETARRARGDWAALLLERG
jgi:ribosomal protein L11 methyltransferase